MNETWRLFVAIELPPHVLKAIAQVQADLKQSIPDRAVRWTRPEGIHLTLKFLGDVCTGQLDEIKAALLQAVARHIKFNLGIQELGCFPNLSRPRVLWLGLIEDTESLQSLQITVERLIAPLGFPQEERGFSPHLTLGRIARSSSREDVAQIGTIVREHDVGYLMSWRVESVSLMRSHLKPTGAQYTGIIEAVLKNSL